MCFRQISMIKLVYPRNKNIFFLHKIGQFLLKFATKTKKKKEYNAMIFLLLLDFEK